jgi:putative salt-induced outer membrane protein
MKIRRICGVLCAPFLCLLAGLVHGQQEMMDSPVWGGSMDFGYIETSGNTEGQTLNFNFDFGKDGIDWRHALHMEAYNQTSDDTRTAEKYMGSWQSNLKFGERQSVFYRGQYEEDKFSSYSAQGSVSVGYGNRVVDNETVILDLDVGPGYRRSKLADTGEIENEVIVRFAGNLKWNISETAAFGQTLSVEEGNKNTVVRSKTSLTMDIYKALALKLGYNLRWNRSVSPGIDNWDRETSISVVYQW